MCIRISVFKNLCYNSCIKYILMYNCYSSAAQYNECLTCGLILTGVPNFLEYFVWVHVCQIYYRCGMQGVHLALTLTLTLSV